MVRSYSVEDMTCQSCVKHITSAVQAVPGVQGVEVSLATGSVRVEATPEVPSETIVAAISAAGYPNVAPLAQGGTDSAAQGTTETGLSIPLHLDQPVGASGCGCH